MQQWKKLLADSGVGILITSLIRIAFEGVLGNRADGLFVSIVSFNLRNTLIWIGLAILVLIGYKVYNMKRYYENEISKMRNNYEILNKRKDLGDKMSLIRQSILQFIYTIAIRLDQAKDREKFNEITNRILRDIADVLPDRQFRISIFMRDKKEPDYLTRWKSSGIPSETLEKPRFYIGNQTNIRRGIAGKSYMMGKPYNVTIEYSKGERIVSDLDYKDFGPSTGNKKYRAFRVIPLKNDNECIGVISFDSMDKNVFDDPSITETLDDLSNQIAIAILLYQTLYNTIRPKLGHGGNDTNHS
ncbi:GAF domain-containing protein [Herpetosiphon giganteus]|uniref:GAF domain-containing protein n=1 Tax=Herpetosiphon giganteus TaxID=2029754 RepID=UPI00195B189B|nr:GAF domain-containing protein [Herpetosiphon giganteus]MBM7846263.1 transcriptional regulator with GAF, ATPase, and Fis domain [Herpetosiphon giganteus]